jgi:hypothetical protein
MKKLNYYIVYHSTIEESFTDSIPNDTRIFTKVGFSESKIRKELQKLELNSLPNYFQLSQSYGEGQVLFNLFLNPQVYTQSEYIGFGQYDIQLLVPYKNFENYIKPNNLLAFEYSTLRQDYNQRILMDLNQRNKLCGEGYNCYNQIIKDYNYFFKTNHKLEDHWHKEIALCSAFIIKTEIYTKLMNWLYVMILSNKWNWFDENNQHRIQAGLFERHCAVFLMLENLNYIRIPTIHHGTPEFKQYIKTKYLEINDKSNYY